MKERQNHNSRKVNWDAIEWEEVRPGVRRKVFATADVMLVMNELDPGAMEVRPHTHEDFDQLVTILSGRARLQVGQEKLEVGPGDLVTVPAQVEHCIEPLGTATDLVTNIDVFVPPRRDLQPGKIKEEV